MDKSIHETPPITNTDDTLPKHMTARLKDKIEVGVYLYLFPLFLIYLLYHFRIYYKTHNIIYIFLSIIVLLYLIFHYFIMQYMIQI